MPDLKKTLGYKYLQATKLDREKIFSPERPNISPALEFKQYSDAQAVFLPEPEVKNLQTGLFELLSKNISDRHIIDTVGVCLSL